MEKNESFKKKRLQKEDYSGKEKGVKWTKGILSVIGFFTSLWAGSRIKGKFNQGKK